MFPKVEISNPSFGVLVGFASLVSLCFLYHSAGFSFSSSEGYQYSGYFVNCVVCGPGSKEIYQSDSYFVKCVNWSFLFLYFIVSFIWGRIGFQPRWVAIGMILPVILGTVIEMFLDPTQHNLLVFEIILYWIPAFVISQSGGLLGKTSARSFI